jgi:hypothetical protein
MFITALTNIKTTTCSNAVGVTAVDFAKIAA